MGAADFLMVIAVTAVMLVVRAYLSAVFYDSYGDEVALFLILTLMMT
jgi:hypothetical protein